MLKKAIYNISIVSLLLINSLRADPGDKITFQLLVEDQDIQTVQRITKTEDLPRTHSIAHPHVSFLQIEDKNNVLRENFGEVMEMVTKMLENYRTVLKGESKELAFLGHRVKGYNSQANGQTYWCLEDADKYSEGLKPNRFFKFVAGQVKSEIEKYIKEKSQKDEGFSMKTPGQIVQGMAAQMREDAEAYVEFSKGFPHMSIAKGSDLNPALFSEAEEVPIPLAITGINAVFTYQGSTLENPIPQVYVKKYFGHHQVELSSQFHCLRDYNGIHSNLKSLLQDIEGLNSSYVQSEIQQLAKLKKQRIDADITMEMPEQTSSLKAEGQKLKNEIERLQKYISLQEKHLGDKANPTKRKRDESK